MRIGALAELSGLTPQTIRYYESIDLLADPERTPAGYREYSAVAVERLRFVREAQSSGLTLTEIQSILELKDAGATSCRHSQALLDQRLVDLDNQIAALRNARDELAAMAERADRLDPAECTDPNRCQVISAGLDDAEGSPTT